jgi:hypothetical protein
MPLERVVKHGQRLMRCYAKCWREVEVARASHWLVEDQLATEFFWLGRASRYYTKHTMLLNRALRAQLHPKNGERHV